MISGEIKLIRLNPFKIRNQIGRQSLKRPETLNRLNILILNSWTLKWAAMKAYQTTGWIHIFKMIQNHVSHISDWVIFFSIKNAQANPGDQLVFLYPFLKIEIKFSIFFGKNTLIVFIYGLHFSFKMLF